MLVGDTATMCVCGGGVLTQILQAILESRNNMYMLLVLPLVSRESRNGTVLGCG